jgi:hypothetical protein
MSLALFAVSARYQPSVYFWQSVCESCPQRPEAVPSQLHFHRFYSATALL